MGKFEVTLPAMGEGIIEATIIHWFVKEGETIEEDQPLLEIATDKVDSEIPSQTSGIIRRIFFKEGEIPKVGEVLAVIENELIQQDEFDGIHQEIFQIEFTPDDKLNRLKTSKEKKSEIEVSTTENSVYIQDRMLISPFIRFMAKNREIEYNELMQIKGSGLGGRITKIDLNNYISSGRRFSQSGEINNAPSVIKSVSEPDPINLKTVLLPGEEIIEMDRMRKLIAAHMVNSKKTSPHVTSMIEIDVTNVVQWRNKHKDEFAQRYGVKLTYTPLMVVAVVRALKDFPGINISVSGEQIIMKKYFNIGIATALPDGNLIVPVIKDADKCNFNKVVLTLADLADRARKNKLEPAEIKGGTFTITNLGPYDNITGTPIINQPEVAILAVGAIKRKPWVVITGGQETIGIRDILILSLTYDHRVVDGSLGGSFLKAIGEYFSTDLPEI